ncbi:MAG TPA: hypothetical protein GXX16_12620, partial [Epulopiscium sp.]|nr:hypothetical protein [Candidatus Epulonipiscium sp.]
HGLQAAVISLFSHKVLKNKPVLASGIGVTIGAVIMVVGYTLGKIYVYSTFEYVMVKLPYEIAQGQLVQYSECYYVGDAVFINCLTI